MLSSAQRDIHSGTRRFWTSESSMSCHSQTLQLSFYVLSRRSHEGIDHPIQSLYIKTIVQLYFDALISLVPTQLIQSSTRDQSSSPNSHTALRPDEQTHESLTRSSIRQEQSTGPSDRQPAHRKPVPPRRWALPPACSQQAHRSDPPSGAGKSLRPWRLSLQSSCALPRVSACSLPLLRA